MTQTTIVTTLVADELVGQMLLSSAGSNGLWATAVWGTRGASEPDTVLEFRTPETRARYQFEHLAEAIHISPMWRN